MTNSKKISSISFFCPAYNDALNLPDLIPGVIDFLERNAEVFEVIIIDDGAKDGTGIEADHLAKTYPQIKVIHHHHNRGYDATLKEGFMSGRYDYILYTDGDNQYNISDLEPHLHLLDNNDMLIGFATSKAVSFPRKIQSQVYNLLVNIMFGVNFKDINCSLKICKKAVIDSIDIRSDSFGAFIDAEIVLKAYKNGFKIIQFPVTHYRRRNGVASGSRLVVIWHTFRDMLKLKFNLI